MAYRVKLDVFEGPFDLLLFLIRKHEIDIYDIPIHNVTQQFLEYIELMKILDLDIAGEFIEMVATLMNIKARMLLPKPFGINEDDVEDPRTELVERLLEYKRFKQVALDMYDLEDKSRDVFIRKYFPDPLKEIETSPIEYLRDITLFDLLLAFKKALDNIPKVTYHEVRSLEVTVEQQTEHILHMLAKKPMLLFTELVEKYKEKVFIVVTFVALLELIIKKQILVRQSELFDDIRIKQWSD